MVPICTMEPPGLGVMACAASRLSSIVPMTFTSKARRHESHSPSATAVGLAAGRGHVDQNVDPAEAGQGLVDQHLARGQVGEVEAMGSDVGPGRAGGGHLEGHGLEAGGVPRRHHDVGALPSQRGRHRPARCRVRRRRQWPPFRRGMSYEVSVRFVLGSVRSRSGQSPRSGAHWTPLMWPPPSTKSVLPVT